MSYLEKARARLKQIEPKQAACPEPPITDLTEGRIIAVKICSHVLDACIWFSFDPDFKPDDDEQLVIFYAEEIPFLSDKTTEQLRKIHQWKLTFGSQTFVRQ
jgi:hypothetical protein